MPAGGLRRQNQLPSTIPQIKTSVAAANGATVNDGAVAHEEARNSVKNTAAKLSEANIPSSSSGGAASGWPCRLPWR